MITVRTGSTVWAHIMWANRKEIGPGDNEFGHALDNYPTLAMNAPVQRLLHFWAVLTVWVSSRS